LLSQTVNATTAESVPVSSCGIRLTVSLLVLSPNLVDTSSLVPLERLMRLPATYAPPVT